MSVTSTNDLMSMVDTWSSMTAEEQAVALDEYFAAGGTLADFETAIQDQQKSIDDATSQDKSYYSSVAAVSTTDTATTATKDALLASIQTEIDNYNTESDNLTSMEETAKTESDIYTAHNVTADGAYTTGDTLDSSTTVVEVTNTSEDPFSTTDSTTFEQYLIDEGITDATTGVVLKDVNVDGEFNYTDIETAQTNYDSSISYQFITLTASSDEAWQLVTWDPSGNPPTVKFKKYNVNDPTQYAYYEFHVESLNPPPPTLRFIFEGGVDTTSVDSWSPELQGMSFYGTATTSIADEIAGTTATDDTISNNAVIPNYTEAFDGLTSTSVTQYVDGGALTGDNLTLAQDALDILYSYLNDPTLGSMSDAVAEIYQQWTEAGISPEEIAQLIQSLIMTVAINDYAHFSTFFASVKTSLEQSLNYVTTDHATYTANDQTCVLLLEMMTGGDITAFFSPDGVKDGSWTDHTENVAALTNLLAIETLGGILPNSSISTLIGYETTLETAPATVEETVAYNDSEATDLASTSKITQFVHQYNPNELIDTDCTTEGEASTAISTIISDINTMWADGTSSLDDMRRTILDDIAALPGDEQDDVAALLTAYLHDYAPDLFTALFNSDFKTDMAAYIYNNGGSAPYMLTWHPLNPDSNREDDIGALFKGYHDGNY